MVFSSKSSSTPTDLTRGIMRCLEKSSMVVKELVNFVHGSTVAINTVIERKGAATALIVTQGTRDVYKIGRGNRPGAYDLFFKRPVPLVPRRLTFEVEERLYPTGEILVPLNLEQAGAAIERVAHADVEAVAICLLHSWVNPDHEARIGELLAAACPDKYISLSQDILREYGEYERISTTVLNAYIGPRVSTYVAELERVLAGQGFSGSLLIMQSNGGVMSPETARMMPVAMLESGPVGGFIAAARVGARLGYQNVIGFDMGGTTAKTNLVKDGVPQLSHGYYIGGYASGHPMMLPVVDTIEIGAGGGSIAWVDEVGALHVGPQSAGAEPGPICYSRGGLEPTITDANLVLGRLSPTEFLGGEMPLDAGEARRGIREKVAVPTGVAELEAALAITKIAVMNMSLAVRAVSVERGYDPRDFAMIAFGGAGGLHAVEVARELHIPRVIIPNYPGQFSALGMLMADIQHDYVQTYYRSLAETDFGAVERICGELIARGRARLEGEQVPEDAMLFQSFLDLRYAGQDFSIPVPVPAEYIRQGDAAGIEKSFNELHERRYGYHTPEHALEIVNVRVSAIGKRKQIELPVPEGPGKGNPLAGKRLVYFNDSKTPVDCPTFKRELLSPGFKITGPAVVQEYASTTVLFPGDTLTVADTGELLITIEGS